MSVAFNVVLGALILVLAIGLSIVADRIWVSAQQIQRSGAALSAAAECERTLREYQRVSNLYVITPTAELRSLREAMEGNLRAALDDVGDAWLDVEEPLHDEASESTLAYLTLRHALEAQRVALPEILSTSKAAFERALASTSAVRDYHRGLLEERRHKTERLLRIELLLTFGTTSVLIIGLVAIVFGVRRFVLSPLDDLRRAMQRFRRNDFGATARGGAILEIQELATTFNDMADTITHQRRDQLAFLAGVAHDLRNPLASLKLLVESFARKPERATPDRLATVDRNLDRLNRMVGDLLDATRIEAGQLEIHLEDVDARETAKAIIELFSPTTAHVVMLKAPDAPVMTRADPLRLEQILSNLLSNAIKYSPEGGAIEVVVAPHDEHFAEIAVRDQGVGIPQHDIATIFDPFRRRAETSRVIAGAGLGLSVVRHIVMSHGGRIEVESTPGVGSTFRVLLPLAVT